MYRKISLTTSKATPTDIAELSRIADPIASKHQGKRTFLQPLFSNAVNYIFPTHEQALGFYKAMDLEYLNSCGSIPAPVCLFKA